MLHPWSNAISIYMLVAFVALELIDLFKVKRVVVEKTPRLDKEKLNK
jgi:hypothetical protein